MLLNNESVAIPTKNKGSCTLLKLIGALSLDNIGTTVTWAYEHINSESVVRFFGGSGMTNPLEKKFISPLMAQFIIELNW